MIYRGVLSLFDLWKERDAFWKTVFPAPTEFNDDNGTYRFISGGFRMKKVNLKFLS
jgi:hypothetical protein